LAQEWELGGGVGWAFAKENTVRNANGSAMVGPKNGFIATAYGNNLMHKYLSGEARYMYRKGNARVKQGGMEADIAGESHSILYELLFHLKQKGSRVRPFFAAGGGAKVFRTTGIERADQALDDFVLLTRKTETKPMFSVGAGIAVLISESLVLRFDFRDQMSMFPDKIYQPAPGAELRGWLHDFNTTVTIGVTF
jgi:hypothetical protein